ncbi:uncharacterized protein [Littorina saxatilis]|uniref:Conodipine-M alpha chain n=1 Tax=Littorina saxatilis TaxID=31220 RepID=A0AAN9BB91_9CAEN
MMRSAVLAACVCVTLWGLADADCSRHSDGCTNMGLFTEFESVFTPACQRHDACYHCGDGLGYKRTQCDQTFLHNLVTACTATVASASLERCKSHAYIYFGAVSFFGEDFYSKGGNPRYLYCQESWVPACLR